MESLFELNEEKANKVFKNEKVIDYLNDKISSTKITDKALEVYINMDEDQIHVVDSLENEIDELSVKFPENHIERLKTEKCDIESGVIFTDTIIDLERIADHAKSIAFSIASKRRRKFILGLKKAISCFA